MGKEFFVDIFTCRGNLKDHLVLIPAMPFFWDTVICRNSGFELCTVIIMYIKCIIHFQNFDEKLIKSFVIFEPLNVFYAYVEYTLFFVLAYSFF